MNTNFKMDGKIDTTSALSAPKEFNTESITGTVARASETEETETGTSEAAPSATGGMMNNQMMQDMASFDNPLGIIANIFLGGMPMILSSVMGDGQASPMGALLSPTAGTAMIAGEVSGAAKSTIDSASKYASKATKEVTDSAKGLASKALKGVSAATGKAGDALESKSA